MVLADFDGFAVNEIEVFQILESAPDVPSVEPPVPSIDSQIISEIPELFADFGKTHFQLLWRGSVDAFNLARFSEECSDFGNTVTLISDANGNIFGGFTPAMWCSPNSPKMYVGERTNRSVIFTLKNPHGLPARKFVLSEDHRNMAIRRGGGKREGPRFGDDLGVADDGTGTKGFSAVGSVYVNDTEVDGETLLTGSKEFEIKEIEVFYIYNVDPWLAQLLRQRQGGLDSRIIDRVPDIFAEFEGKEVQILWRGSRDGFAAKEFHRRCDGHANTLTVIATIDGDVFGGFTPVEWEAPAEEKYKKDESLKTCLFTLRNSFGVPPRRFPMEEVCKSEIIVCHAKYGPWFGRGSDLRVSNQCHANTFSAVGGFGDSFVNDTGLGGNSMSMNNFLAGSDRFQVAEIEVFEIKV